MTKPPEIELHTLPAMSAFIHNGQPYQTITPIKYTVVNKTRKTCKRSVLNLVTYKEERLPFFTLVDTSANPIFRNF